jgi:hypothetical protein
MSEATKAEARDKLARLSTKIGYPDRGKDYAGLEVRRADLVGNLARSARVEHERAITKLRNPVDRSEWLMTPQTVNAYYNPPMNEIVFPAAILQPPFFDAAADNAINYGAIGAVIGHEISHAFDDQGSKYDGVGNLRTGGPAGPPTFRRTRPDSSHSTRHMNRCPARGSTVNSPSGRTSQTSPVSASPTRHTASHSPASPLLTSPASPATSGSFSAGRRAGGVGSATRRCASDCSATRTAPPSTASTAS